MKSRIMYIECKTEGLNSAGRIGRVRYSKSGATLYYKDKVYVRFTGYKANYYDIETGDEYWISGPKKHGGDRLYGTSTMIEIDEDVADEYWRTIRGCQPPKNPYRLA